MAKKDDGTVKKEMAMFIAVGALVVGFLAGIVFSAYQKPAVVATAPQGQGGAPQQQGFTQQQADRILALEREVSQNPNNYDAWVALGNQWFDSNNYQKAIDAYLKALAIRPNDPNVLTDMGVMYRRVNEPLKAIDAFDKAIAADPNHQVSRFNKGIVYLFDLKQVDEGIKTWEELAKINPAYSTPDGRLITTMIEDLKKTEIEEKVGNRSKEV